MGEISSQSSSDILLVDKRDLGISPPHVTPGMYGLGPPGVGWLESQ